MLIDNCALPRKTSERGVYTAFEWLTRTADKAAMAQAFRGRVAMGKVLFPRTDWADRVINQCVGFPAAKHDDAVDACALLGMAEVVSPGKPVKAEPKAPVDYWGRRFRRAERTRAVPGISPVQVRRS